MNFLKFLRSKAKYLLSIAMLSALLSQLILPIVSVRADSPRFNFLDGDVELIRGANVTQNESVWKDPITGTAGDEFRGLIYYHNGILGTTANNTRIKVNLPSSTTNKTAHITVSISADNAVAVSNTVINGQIIGPEGLTINLDQNAEVEFVPGSVKWFPNSSQTPSLLPSGQNGDEIITGNGLNIDGIQGCWPFAGFVTFGFKSVKRANLAINIDKMVRNLTSGEQNFREITNAGANEAVEFNLQIENTGDVALDNVVVKDILPSELNFISGSLVQFIDDNSESTSLSDDEASELFNDGLDIGTMDPGFANRYQLRFKAKASSDIKVEQKVINTGEVSVAELSDSDTATVVLVPTAVTIKKPVMSVEKTVRNFTTSETSFTKSNQASAGDILEYRLIISNTGNGSADQVNISDVLPPNTQFISGTTTFSRNNGTVSTLSDGIVGNGTVIDVISAGDTIQIRFRANISTNVAASQVLINRANVIDNGATISDTAQTTIKAAAIPAPTQAPLPVTGSTSVILSFLGTLLSGIGLSYYKYRKFLGTPESAIISQLLK